MNTGVASLVPAAPAAIVQTVEVVGVEQRHQRMLVMNADIMEALQEDLTTEGMDYIDNLIGQLRADLAYCRAAPLKLGEAIPA